MIGCLLIAFHLCQTGSYAYAQSGSYAYAQQGYYQPAPAYVVQQPPVYVVQPQPVIVGPPIYYGGGYGYQNPFPGINVAVGPRGGVRIGVR